MKQGYAKRNRGSGAVDWAHLAKIYPLYKEQIFRVRKSPRKLQVLKARLEAKYA